MIKDERIDHGNEFDWGRASSDYAKYRDIYPQIFYDKILEKGLCVNCQEVLDLGTGTGVLPRNLYRYGASFTGTDIAKEQIEKAIELSKENNMEIRYDCVATEDLDYPPDSFDVITACQCFFYFRHQIAAKKLARLLKDDGKLVILYLAWLPDEDPIAGGSEKLVLTFNPSWTGKEEVRRLITVPEEYFNYFELESEEIYDLSIPFTRASWNGRIRACRGIGASLPAEQVQAFHDEHLSWLKDHAPEKFEVLHYAAMTVLSKKR